MNPDDRYLDRRGEYQVYDLIGTDTVRYFYLDDPLKTLHMAELEVKRRIYQNVLADQAKTRMAVRQYEFLGQPDVDKFVEVLIDHGRINVDVPAAKLDAFRDRYYTLTGTWPSDDAIALDVCANKWGLALKVEFPHRFRDQVPTQFTITNGDRMYLAISNNRFIWELIEIGFRLGIQHRVTRRVKC